jgi:predicted GNAT superfamily acetyltransferase
VERRLIDDAWRHAADAAERSRVTVRPLETIDEIVELDAMFARVWGASHAFVPIELTRAMRYAGNYVVGAFADADGRMVGGSLGFFGEHAGRPHLHSHITGVLPDLQARSLGFAIKVHQRAWCLAAGLDEVVWTFDPLIRRNAYFNLAKLGAEMVGYEKEFYGVALNDDVNRGDESDRGVIRWSIASDRVAALLGGGRVAAQPDAGDADDAAVILDEDGIAAPEPSPSVGCALRAWVPADIVAIRRADPAGARAWRHAFRATVGTAITRGYVAVAMSRDGWYRLERPGAQ